MNVDLDAKETRMVILSLQLMLKQTLEQLKTLDSEDDEYTFLSNDAAMIDSIIGAFQVDYRERFGPKGV